MEGVDFDKTFDPLTWLEAIRLLKLRLHQIIVKTTFLNKIVNNEVYVAQPKRIEDCDRPEYVYTLKKVL